MALVDRGAGSLVPVLRERRLLDAGVRPDLLHQLVSCRRRVPALAARTRRSVERLRRQRHDPPLALQPALRPVEPERAELVEHQSVHPTRRSRPANRGSDRRLSKTGSDRSSIRSGLRSWWARSSQWKASSGVAGRRVNPRPVVGRDVSLARLPIQLADDRPHLRRQPGGAIGLGQAGQRFRAAARQRDGGFHLVDRRLPPAFLDWTRARAGSAGGNASHRGRSPRGGGRRIRRSGAHETGSCRTRRSARTTADPSRGAVPTAAMDSSDPPHRQQVLGIPVVGEGVRRD